RLGDERFGARSVSRCRAAQRRTESPSADVRRRAAGPLSGRHFGPPNAAGVGRATKFGLPIRGLPSSPRRLLARDPAAIRPPACQRPGRNSCAVSSLSQYPQTGWDTVLAVVGPSPWRMGGAIRAVHGLAAIPIAGGSPATDIVARPIGDPRVGTCG